MRQPTSGHQPNCDAAVQNLPAVSAQERTDGRTRNRSLSRYLSAASVLALFVGGFAFTSCSRPHSETPVSGETKAEQPIAEPSEPAAVTVIMRNMKFEPPAIEVKKGETVEWTNKDITPHTATAPSFDSGSIGPGKSWRHTFTETGNFAYTCTFHPAMKAAVNVK